jgi:hypothetical protein
VKKMKKIYKGLAVVGFFPLLIVLVLHYSGWSLVHDLIFKKYPLSAQETSFMVYKLYNELGPRIGCHLVEPNVVITLAGLRGNGNFLMHDLTANEKSKIEGLNKKVEPVGIKFFISYDLENEIADIMIINLKGLEYSSKKSKLPFIKPFNAATGFIGYRKWSDTVTDNAKKYFNITNDEQEGALMHLMVGLSLGYPDQALLDMYNTVNQEGLKGASAGQSSFIYSKISYSDYYDNPQPNFGYLPEHEDEESIVRVKKAWGALLGEFYNTTWAKSLAQDPQFAAMRSAEEKAHQEWFLRKR